MMHREQLFGGLLGEAVGDAFGYFLNRLSMQEIVEERDTFSIVPYLEVASAATLESAVLEDLDDTIVSEQTQLLLFTMEGMMIGNQRERRRGATNLISVCFFSYQRWLYTQGFSLADKEYEWVLDEQRMEFSSPLFMSDVLFHDRTISDSCSKIFSMIHNQDYGTIEQPINDDTGCGSLARVIPVGFYYYDDAKKAFRVASEIAAISHGNPKSYLGAGFLASIISNLCQGKTIPASIDYASSIMNGCSGATSIQEAVDKAKKFAMTPLNAEEIIHTFGEGYVVEEAIAIALYACLSYQKDYVKAICLSMNYHGNTVVTGAVAGAIMGTYLGQDVIPATWYESIDCRAMLVTMGEAFLAMLNQES